MQHTIINACGFLLLGFYEYPLHAFWLHNVNNEECELTFRLFVCLFVVSNFKVGDRM